MEKSRVVVTGGAGFIGSHVCGALLASGRKVAALDNLQHGSRDNVPAGASLEVADIRDRGALDKFFSEFKPEVVVHHAAQVSVRDSVADPVADAEANVIGSLNLLEACVAHGVGRFVFASTGGAIYGEQEAFPATETHPERPLSPYGVAKLAVEKYLHFYESTHGLSWAALRYSNVYGPRQDPFGEAGVVAIFCERMLSGKDPVINGDGGQTRDYVFVEDVAHSNLLALEKNARGPVNVATGVETSVNDVFRMLARASGKTVKEVHGPAKPGEQRRSVLDASLAENLMGWTPSVALEDGLARTMEYFKGKR